METQSAMDTWDPWRAKLRTFSAKTLQDNWLEERIQVAENEEADQELLKTRQSEEEISLLAGFGNVSQPLAQAPLLVRHSQPPTNRVLRAYTVTTKEHYATTTSLAHQGEQNKPPPPKAAKMISQKNYYAEMRMDRTHPTLPQTGFGSVLPAHPPNYGESHFETTTGHFFQKKVAEDKCKPAPPEQGDDKRWVGGYPASHNPNAADRGEVYSHAKTFYHTPQLPSDTLDTFVNTEPPRGKVGSRGHLVRSAVDAGSKYGSHVWADEQAQV
uniref:Uncharacterized protein n=1 Tax=Pyramimonas obovata TaxID=1411642 RepID=A0A7S0WX89_9CHLO|mmetsp:Transcript_7185/g.14596  ORF Transcript_7185/g.14596 Transcript_7185/m.14596 type:complete len:270 (+) Transcript_7185:118-927(+)